MLKVLLLFSLTKSPDNAIGVDKLKHFFMSAFIQTASYSSLRAVGAGHRESMAGAIGTTAVFGVAREVYDGRVKGRFSYKDLAWDAAGIAAGAVICNNTEK
jgi:uncharacterized protein YfiM (DUF2279 family)